MTISFNEVRSPSEASEDAVRAAMSALSSARQVEPVRGDSRLRLLLLGLDFSASFVAWLFAIQVIGSGTVGGGPAGALWMAAVFSAITMMVLWVYRLYQDPIWALRPIGVSQIAGTVVIACLVAASLYRFAGFGPSLEVDEVAAAASLVLLASLRFAYASWMRTCHVRGLYCRPVCIIGDNEEARTLVDILAGQPELGYRVLAVLGDPEEWSNQGSDVPAIDPGTDLIAATRQAGASGVVIAVSAIEPRCLEPLVRQMVARGLHVQISTGMARIGHRRMRLAPVSHQMLYYVEHPNLSLSQRRMKRAIDLVGASAALALSAPVFLAAAVAIKLDDGGPVFYRQQRVGHNGRLFGVVKLRTMVPDANSRRAELLALNERNGPLFKLGHDPRVTKVGRFLRTSSIDELPQLFNVLRGEMSLVGPRPALPEEVEQFDLELLERVSVPPGLTGLWQVSARDDPSFSTYRRLDLFYVDNWSVTMDLTIICSTIAVVVRRAVRSLRGGSEMAGPRRPAEVDVVTVAPGDVVTVAPGRD